MSVFDKPSDAGRHVVSWFDVEERDYASQGKFGYQNNLRYLRQAGLECHSVWSTQLTDYWNRATIFEKSLRGHLETTKARQLFAKQANAIRALVATVRAQQFNGDYDAATQETRIQLEETAASLDANGLPFDNPNSFDPSLYWAKHLQPEFTEARRQVRAGLPGGIAWESVVSTTNENVRHGRAIVPLGNMLLKTFGVVTAYVFHDGPLPQPGVPSGEVQAWQP